MSTTLGSPLLAIILAALPAHDHFYAERPGHWVLVQSEFDYLPAQPRITLRVDRMTPKEFVDALARESRLTIALQGELPSVPLLSASFRDADPKEAFQWLAERLPVVFMAKPPNTLLIFVNGKRG